MSELKLCPFCGEKARIVQTDPLNKDDKLFFVYRVLCKCGANILKCSEEEAIEAWNRREGNG